MKNKEEMLQRVLEIENQELKGTVDEKLYLEKIELLCMLSGSDVDKVWGEYKIVQNITSQPVLMNKAMSIPLTKNEVSLLITDLSKNYERDLKANSIENVNLIFSTTLRGHAKEVSKQIVLPKLGEWRFGYKNVYSSELIFHEFSHLLDYGRYKRQSYGKTDIHKHDFVRILDRMLERYREFIESKYIPSRQREQILNNGKLIVDFHANKEEIIAEDMRLEEEILKQKEIESESKRKELGFSENSFPIHIIMETDKELKTKFIQFMIEFFQKSTPMSLELKSNIEFIREEFMKENPVMNKAQMDILIKALDKTNTNEFLLTLPLMQQIKAINLLRTFSDEIRDLSKGKMRSVDSTDNFKVRTYSEAELLKKRNFED